MLPIANSYPPGQGNPIAFRAFAALPAAGAWDATPIEIPVIGFDYVTLYMTYIEGAEVEATGAVDWYLEYSPYSVEIAGIVNWFQMSLYAPGGMVAGTDIQSNVQREYITYGATSTAQESWIYGPISIMQTVERLRIVARESGDEDNPGDFGVIGVAHVD